MERVSAAARVVRPIEPASAIEVSAIREEDVAVAECLVAQAERRLEIVGDTEDGGSRPAVYELPDGSRPRTPRRR